MMKKTHYEYLVRAVNLAANLSGNAILRKVITGKRIPAKPEYVMIRDIVCDARFYTVLDNDIFWRNYAIWSVQKFIDSLSADDWENEEHYTELKEDFLTRWMLRHINGLTDDEIADIKRQINEEKSSDTSPNNTLIQENGEEETISPTTEDSDIVVLCPFADDMSFDNDTVNDNENAISKEMMEYLTQANAQTSEEAETHQAEARYLESIDPVLVELARKIGQSGEAQMEFSGTFTTASRSDISGITTGNDLNSVLPHELAILATPEAEDIFYRRYVERGLQIFSSASRSQAPGEKECGPIYICIDTSGSMSGEPESMAKSLTLAVAIIAQSEKRNVCIFNYSDRVTYFVLTNLARQRTALLKFLSMSYGGGNNENRLFDFIFRYLPYSRRYAKVARRFKSADILVISDFQWGYINENTFNLLGKARSDGMRFYAIAVNRYLNSHSSFPQEYSLRGESPQDYSYEEEKELMDPGISFLRTCNETYTFTSHTGLKLNDLPNS